MHPPPHWIVATLLLPLHFGCKTPTQPNQSLQSLATATQKGPVGYRDPAGAVSPNGAWLAYTEGRDIIVQPLTGGGKRILGPAPSQVRYLTWLPGSRQLAVHERNFDRATQTWNLYDLATGQSSLLWGDGIPDAEGAPRATELYELNWNRDGSRIAGVRRTGGRSEVWSFKGDGSEATLVTTGAQLSFPVWTADGRIACLRRSAEGQFLHLPADSAHRLFDDREVYGHVAFTEGDASVIFATPNDVGVLELWATRLDTRAPFRRLAQFARDAYEPFVLPDGRVVFKTQDYRVFIATSPVAGGETVPLTTFQSETPTWSRDGKHIGVTFGGWRIATDDIAYPDISQHLGIVHYKPGGLVDRPSQVVRQSYSEDQGLHWSPNGKWIVYHSHIDGTDDIYLVPTDGSAEPRMISENGHETGWPRWSADGHWILYPSYERDQQGARRSVLYTIEVDQQSGATQPQRMVKLDGFSDDALQAGWGSSGDLIVFEAAEGAGRKALYTVARVGGRLQRLHRWRSEQLHSGIAVSPDFGWVAYIAPGDDHRFQVFRVPLGGGTAEQLTKDPTDKTQPAFSPSGDRLAFTVFSYQAQFWAMDL